LDFAGENDFIYFDPPYQPLSKTSNFTSYTKNSFNEEQQFRLSRVFEKLDHKGCKIMMSNSDTALIRELYDKFRIEVVYASRAISCKAEGRGKINELVIMNY
jgi:DNA adenine methylase